MKKEQTDEVKEKKTGKILTTIIILIAAAVMIFALSKLVPILLDYYNSEKTYEDLAGNFVITQDESDQEEEESDEAWRNVQISFGALKQENADIIGWIRFDDLDSVPVNYPILYSGDNETYLRNDLYGNKHTAGSIFMDGMNQPDFSDYHTIIYGHNMKNGTMFGSLKKYRNEDNFWENNQYFTIYTEDTVYRYQIFSYYNVSDTSNIYTVGFGPGEEFQQFIDGMVASSYENTGISPQSDNHIVTLSTCTSAGDDKRFVIHAVCIEESPYNGQ